MGASTERVHSTAGVGRREQTRARYPDRTGYVERDGVRVFYEVYGTGEPTVLLLPTWSIVHSRFWKAQIPYLARHLRVVTFDGRGNGRSDRPAGAHAYSASEFADDALAVMDATQTERAALVALSSGALWATILAADHPDRVDAIVYIGPAVTLISNHPERDVSAFEDAIETDPEWAKAAGTTGPRLHRLRRVLLLQVLHRAALNQADRGLHRLGDADHTRNDPRHRRSASECRARNCSPKPARACAARRS